MNQNDAAFSAVSADAQPDMTAGTQTTATDGKRPRSKVELAIVRGGIVLLFVVMLVELVVSRSFQSDFAAAHEALGAGPVTESDIKRLITQYSSVESNGDLKANRLVATREDTYRYRGLLKQRVLYVYYGVVHPTEKEAEVLDITVEPTEFATTERRNTAGSEAANAGAANAGAANGGVANGDAVPAAARPEAGELGKPQAP